MTNRYVVFNQVGGPEVLEIRSEAIPDPQEGEIVVRNVAVGFNFIDTYFRKGLYPVELPFRGGSEASGIVHRVGPNIKEFREGDRVAYLAPGAYADYTKVPVSSVARLPDGISFEVAAASVLKGLTVQYLLEKIHQPHEDEVVLFHAGAGGVGLIFLQWARALGAKVITTVSSDQKEALAKAHGAWKVLRYSDDIAGSVKKLTDGKGVKVVFDAVGKDTFEQSLNSLQPRGLMVSFGNASGLVPDIPVTILSRKGSLYLTRPMLKDYIDDFEAQLGSFFKLVTQEVIKIEVKQKYSLENIVQAHKDAEARLTSGSTVILP